MRRTVFGFILAFVVSACSGEVSQPDLVLNEIRPLITKDLTPALAESRIGKPTAVEGSGLLIYRYDLKDRSKLRLGFPGFAPIMYARVEHANGGVTDLPLR